MALLSLRSGNLTIYTLWATLLILFLLFRIDNTEVRNSAPLSRGALRTSVGAKSHKVPTPLHSPQEEKRLKILQKSFCSSYFSISTKYAPQCDPLIHPENSGLDIFYDADKPAPARPTLLTMTNTQQSAMRKAHQGFVQEIVKEEVALPYVAGTRGLVTTAGGVYLPIAVISLRMIRQSGSTLPMEVFLASRAEYDHKVCEELFPSLNARCVVLEDIFKSAGVSVKVEKYQFKSMSIMLSSFEEVLFLDSDAFSVFSPDKLFETEPFKSTGLVLWPDFWYPSESPLFFDIADIEMPSLSEKSSTESGQIMFSKAKHSDSIMLSGYYNLYGPDYYYPLQSQGAPGEGDKETFGWAALAMGKSLYAVKAKVVALGHHTADGQFRGSAMGQHDPEEDYHLSNTSSKTGKSKTPRIFFIHANFPKFDPAVIFDYPLDNPGPTKDTDGKVMRPWNIADSSISPSALGYDIERVFWTQILITACADETKFESWKQYSDICKKTIKYWQGIFGDNSIAIS